jgi:3-oxoacid CoA-transferase
MDKLVASPAAAVADIGDGASVGIAGFGVAHRFPSSLIVALRDQGSSGLTVYCNGLGQPGFPTAHLLADSHQISRLVTCFSARPGVVSEAERQIRAGQMELELVPQGTLVERMRAGGAGIPAFYTPTAVGTSLAAGKDVRYFGGRPYVLERAITTDFAFVRAHRADRMGNLQFRGGSRNFNVSFAKAARITIAEADEIGPIPPEDVDLPGVFVTRVVASTTQLDLAVGARQVIAMCEHTDSAGQPKLVGRCDYEVTAPGCVDTVVTDLALLRRAGGGFRLAEVARGFTPAEVAALTAMEIDVTGDIRIMQECWGD